MGLKHRKFRNAYIVYCWSRINIIMPTTSFEYTTRIVADIGPFFTYYVAGSFVTRGDACWAAAGVGVLGSAMDVRPV